MRSSIRLVATAAIAVFLMSATSLWADDAAKPLAGAGDERASASNELAAPMPSSMGAASPYTRGRDIGTPTTELFLGYSYLHAMPALAEGNRLVWLNGGSANVAYNFNRYLGVVGDFGAYTNSQVRFTGANAQAVDVDNPNVAVLSYLFGPRLSFRGHERFTPFVQALFGGIHANEVILAGCTSNCTVLPAQGSFAMTAGGGLDIKVHKHIAIRLIQAEYLMTRFEDLNTGAKATQNDMRLSAGIVFRFGGNPAPPMPPASPLQYSCSVTPTAVYPGGTIAASGTAVYLNPAKTAVYTWQVDGGAVTGTSSTATIDTANVAVGTYTLKGHVTQGDRAGENADCTAPYSVKAYEPPTVSCSADPAVVLSGATSAITAVGVSPQNRPLTYSFSSNSGSVSGIGSTAVLSTRGAMLGTVGVTCTVVDDKGQTALASTSVMVTAPAPEPKPQTSGLCSIGFERDAARPVRVDNEAKACLDQIAMSLNSSPDAKLAVAGSASSEEKGGSKLAAERAVNTKAYLVTEKGIDGTRIAVYTRAEDGKTVASTLIPAGATLDTTGETLVDESGVGTRPARHPRK